MGAQTTIRVRLCAKLAGAALLAGGVFAEIPPVAQGHAYVTAPNIAVSDYAFNFLAEGFNSGVGPVGLAFDASGNLFVSNYHDGYLYEFPPGGGGAGFAGIRQGFVGFRSAGLAFSKDQQHLYLAHQGDCCVPGDVVEIDLGTLQAARTVAQVPGATGLATDPLNGDLFVTGGSIVSRISNFSSGPGTVVTYANVSFDGITFGADGTLYGAGRDGSIYSVPGTNNAATGPWTGTKIVTVLTDTGQLAPIDGIGVGAGPDPSKPPFLYVNRNDGVITKVDLTTSPPSTGDIVTGGTRGDFVTVNDQGCLFATQSITVIKVTDSAGACNPPLVPTGPPKPVDRQIVFVHGINGSFRSYGPGKGWHQLFDPLVAAFGASKISIIPFYQDLGYRNFAGQCPGMPLPEQSTDQLYVDPNSVDPTQCDGSGALAYTAAALDTQLNLLRGPVAIIANSMGGGITRGWMTLAQCQSLPGCASTRPPDHSLQIVDTVLFLTAVHQGSYLATNGEALLRSNLPTQNPFAFSQALAVIQGFNLDPRRPGVMDVAGDSQWYRRVNPTPPPVGLHYYNIYADIQVKFDSNFITRRLPGLATPFDAGDTVILPGTAAPTDHRLLGGSRFQPCAPGAPDCHEYGVSKTVTLSVWDAFLGQDGAAFQLYLTDPYSHKNFGEHIGDGSITVPSCGTGVGTVTPSSEIIRILRNPANACS